MRALVVLILLCSCAHTQDPLDSLKKDYQADNISLNAIMNITKTSFVKGCLFGSQIHYFEKINKNRFEVCKKAAEAHALELRGILEGPSPLQN